MIGIEKKWWDTSKYYGDSWSISERQNFNSEKQVGKFFNNPTNRSKDKASSNIDAIKDHLEWQRIHFQNPANAYKPEPHK